MSEHSDDEDQRVEIVEYRAEWPAMFEAERASLASALGAWITGEIQHIGSTAVSGMAAKPIIDIMVPVLSLEGSQDAIAVACQLGYNYWPYKSEVMHWFCKPSPGHRTHHLHLVPYGSVHWFQRLAFREALLRNGEIAAQYIALKRTLAENFSNDREAYTDGKSQFIERAMSGGIRPT